MKIVFESRFLLKKLFIYYYSKIQYIISFKSMFFLYHYYLFVIIVILFACFIMFSSLYYDLDVSVIILLDLSVLPIFPAGS